MATSRTLAGALFGLLVLAATAHAETGDGTAYSGDRQKDATGENSCGFGTLSDHWEKMYAALPSGSFNRDEHCGKCIRARGLEAGASGDWVVVKIVDECATCNGGDVDFSTDALSAITGFSWDRKQIEWEFCPCSGASSDTEEQQPAPEEDQPAPEEDQPAPEEDQPAPEEDQPAPEEDQPAPEEDQPAPEDDQPAPKGDKPSHKDDPQPDVGGGRVVVGQGSFRRLLRA